MRKNNKVKYAIAVNIIICLALISALNINVLAAGYTQNILDVSKELVKEYYIEDIPDSKLDKAKDVDSLIKSLNDPYSTYFTEKAYNDFTNSLNNSFVGIGVQIETASEGIKIMSVFDKSPAQEVGLKAGDIITEAEGRSLAGLSTEEAVTFIKGAVGSKVKLQVKRKEELLIFQVERKQMVLPTVEGELMDKHIGYIRINSFGDNTGTEFKNELLELKNSTVDSYIIDLRNNPGGYMNVAFDIAGYFIGSDVVMKSHPKSGETIIYNAIEHKEKIDKPAIFLINHYSASASEILSAAVKDNEKAFFIGEKTYGKGVGQSLFMLTDESYIKLTTFKFVSPLGNEINKIGISPDIEIKDDFEKNVNSLNAAKILLNSLKQSDDNRGTIKVNLAGRDFVINMEGAKSEENVNTLKFMTENLLSKDNVVSGNKTGWEKLSQNITINDFIFASQMVLIAPVDKQENPIKAYEIPKNDSKVVVNNEMVDKKETQESKAADKVEVLPKTGSAYDLYFYVGLGIVFILAGMRVKNYNLNK
jgi:carboxyl-terminal processing protease